MRRWSRTRQPLASGADSPLSVGRERVPGWPARLALVAAIGVLLAVGYIVLQVT